MTRASSDRTAGGTTATGYRLAFIRVIRVIRSSFLACSSTTDYTPAAVHQHQGYFMIISSLFTKRPDRYHDAV
jgi:hypothetical protein